MSKKMKIQLYSMVVIGIITIAGHYLFVFYSQYRAKTLYNIVKSHQKFFIYETYRVRLNNVLYVEKCKDTAELINYYAREDKKDTLATFNFDIRFMPISKYQPVYVVNIPAKGSNVIEVVDFNTKCWGFIKGYVYKQTAHINPASDSLIKSYETHWAKYNSDPEHIKTSKISAKISPYGIYCDE